MHARILGPLVAGMILLGGMVSSSLAADVTIRFPVEYNADLAPGVANQEFIDLIEKRSDGQIKVQFHPAGRLYKGLDLLQAVMRGDAEMATLVSVYWSAISPRLSMLELPFAFPTHEAFYRASDDKKFMATAFEEIEKKGAVVIANLVYDYLPVGNTERALNMPADFRGLKLRALGKTNARTLKLLGAEPIPINVTEVSAALERGAIDGLNTPADAYASYGWDKMIKHVTDSPHYFAFYPWAVNKKWWNRLSEEHRTLIADTVREVTLKHRKRARDEAAKAFKDLAASGVQVHKLSGAEQKQWMRATESQWIDAEKEFGKPMIDALRAFATE